MTKTDYIKKISNASDRYGDKLIKLMDEYQANNLKDITLEQAKQFYEREIKK